MSWFTQNCSCLKIVSSKCWKDKQKACILDYYPIPILPFELFFPFSSWVFILSLVHFFNNMWKPKNGQQKSACGSSVAPVLFDLLTVHQSSQPLTPHRTSVLLPLLVPVYCSSQWQTVFSSTDHLFHLSSSFWPHSFLSILFLVLQLDKAHVISPRNTNWWVWSSTCLRWL